jgi:hypothetical protein
MHMVEKKLAASPKILATTSQYKRLILEVIF